MNRYDVTVRTGPYPIYYRPLNTRPLYRYRTNLWMWGAIALGTVVGFLLSWWVGI